MASMASVLRSILLSGRHGWRDFHGTNKMGPDHPFSGGEISSNISSHVPFYTIVYTNNVLLRKGREMILNIPSTTREGWLGMVVHDSTSID